MQGPSASRKPGLADPFRIGGWRVHASANQLVGHGKTVKLELKAMEVLLYLVERAGQTVTRERLEEDVWKKRVVGYDSLNNTISKLRRALEDEPKNPRFIETIPKIGYRFIGRIDDASRSPTSEEIGGSSERGRVGATRWKTDLTRRASPSPTAAVAILAILILAIAWLWHRDVSEDKREEAPQPLTASGKPSIAVLPFENLSGDTGEEYFSDGITDDLITDLSKISGLSVIARSSVFDYKGKSTGIRNIADRLGVRYVLQGSVRRANERVRINAQLVDAISGTQLWADRYDGPLANIFTLQDDVAGRIVAALKIRLTPEERKFAGVRGTRNIDAYDAYLRGMALVSRKTPEDAAAAIPYFKTALARDAYYGPSYAALAQTHWKYAVNQRFNALVTPSLGAWAPGGYSNYLAAWNFLRKARIRPSPQAFALSARMLQRQRRFDDAMKDAQHAVELAPTSQAAMEALIEVKIYAGEAEVALQRIEDLMRLDPSLPGEKLFLTGLAFYSLSRLEEAVRAIRRARIHNPQETRYAAILAASLSELGRRAEAETAIQDYLSGWETFSDINAIMLEWPFRRRSTARRFATGVIDAGVPAPLGQYFVVSSSDRLTSEEIFALLSKKTMFGIDRGHPGGVRFEVMWDEDMQIVEQGFVNYFEDGRETYVYGDLLCASWRDWDRYCVAVFRNPAGTKEQLDEYVFYTLTSTFTFSMFESSTRRTQAIRTSSFELDRQKTAISVNRFATQNAAGD